MTTESYSRWSADETLLAEIGGYLFDQDLRVRVRLPRSLADAAVAAWDRDDNDETLPKPETREQSRVRLSAAALALIGCSIQNAGFEVGGDVEVRLDAWFIGSALDAAEHLDVLPEGSRESRS